MNPNRVIGVDLGGTKILAGLLDRDGAVLERRETPTPLGSEAELLAGLEEAVAALGEAAAIGLGVPAVVDRREGVARGANNIPLGETRLAERFAARFGVPVGLENDASAAALAEWRAGAGRGSDDVLMLTLGTGVGGGVVVAGRPFRGWAELGHVVVELDGPPCIGACTGRGHLEALASGSAADRAAQELWGEESGAEQLVERARAGDEGALDALRRIGRALGAAIGSFVNIFGSELVVIGGGFGIAAFDLLRGPAEGVARREALAPAHPRFRIVPAELGEDAGLIGAGFVAFDALDGAP